MQTAPPETSAQGEAQRIELSDDKELLDVALIHEFLSKDSYWARNISLEQVVVALENSLCVGAYLGKQQIGFARVVTDYVTDGNIKDVFVVDAYRGNGIASAMLRFTLGHPKLQGLRRWSLATSDAHSLYAKFGFKILAEPADYMEMKPER